MVSAVVIALLLVLMIVIGTGFVVGGWSDHLRCRKMRLQKHFFLFVLSASWYTRRRTLVSLGFLVMVCLTLFVQDGFTKREPSTFSKGIGFTILNDSQASDIQTSVYATSLPVLPGTVSAGVVRIDSASRAQYYTDYQWQVWSYSSCSGIAMAMVMNAYGRHLIAADVLQEEQKLGMYDINLGLLREEGIAMTAAYFGFDTSATHTRTLQDLITISNKGKPIIVGVRDNFYYPGGHIFVVRGGDSQYVYIADSSRANFQRMTHSMFLSMWQGFSAVLTPHQ